MPTTKLQLLFFMSLTVLLSVVAFVNYNIAISMGSMTNQVFFLSLKEIPIEFLFAFLIQFVFGNKLATRMAFKIVDPKTDKPLFIIIAIACMNILIMCPAMSFIATVIHNGININFIANWLQKMTFNFPFAFFIQIFFIGPIVRNVFNVVFKKSLSTENV
ncbi:MAG: DUF2798 domain-containing protein [Chitinispirillaceae bacterium]|nr:DUF2798 domain-containing protein [Chitinispirillaceae bacterium]